MLFVTRAIWWLRKQFDRRRQDTESEAETIVNYHTRAMNIFRALQIDVDSKPAESQRLYHMMLLYMDDKEMICPGAARTASLIGFLDSLGSGWVLPPTSHVISKEFAEQVDGYVAMEIFRNHLGMKDIQDEITKAMEKWQRDGGVPA